MAKDSVNCRMRFKLHSGIGFSRTPGWSSTIMVENWVNSKDANFLWLFSKQIQTGIVYDTKELGTKLTASTTFQSPFLVRTSPQHVHTAELSVNSTRMQIFVAVFKQIKLELFTISKEFETQPEPYYLQIQGGKKKAFKRIHHVLTQCNYRRPYVDINRIFQSWFLVRTSP